MSWRAWLAFAALGIIWGVPYFFIRLAVEELSPYLVAWGRVTLAALILMPLAWQRGALRSLSTHKTAICAFGVIEFAIPFTAISIGERWINSSITGILIAAVPLTVVLLSRFFGIHERMGGWRILGLALGLIGVAALLGFRTISGPLGWAGVGCMLLSTVGYAAGPLIIQRYFVGVDSLGTVAASLTFASLVLLPALLALPGHMPSHVALWSIAVLGIVCTAVAMLLMFYLVAEAGAARASIVTYINPAVAALLGVSFLDERLGTGGIVAFALILAGSWLATRGGSTAHAAVRQS